MNPVDNAILKRMLSFYSHYGHQADQYGLEFIHGLVPDAPLSAAQAFQILGERSLDYPYVGKLAEFWAWDHPTIRDRMIFVQTYDPWGEGREPEFVKGSQWLRRWNGGLL
jgi:hypothetical protein